MRYFTKEWYDLMQRLDYTLCMKPIEDKVYSDDDIRALYEKELKKEIRSAERDYNAPPEFVDFDIDEMDLDDFVSFDPQTNKLVKFSSKQEVIDSIERERRRAMEEFDNRPPFGKENIAEIENDFKQRYEGELKYGMDRYPDDIRSKLDPRLVALGFLPRSVFDELKALSKSNKKKFDAINRQATKVLKKQNLSDEIAEKFYFHDANVLSVKEDGGDLVMLLRLDVACYDGETPYTRVIFKNASVLEREDTADGDCVFLYDEIYKNDGGYEVHILLESDGLKYLTVACKEIAFETDIDENEITR